MTESHSTHSIIKKIPDPAASLEVICDAICEDLHQFIGDAEQFDDITLLAIKQKN